MTERNNNMVLSTFPGIGLLDKAFEDAGFQILRGPDIIWGGDVHRFHVNPGYFTGLIGGPPCQAHSSAGKIIGTTAVDLIGEFVRIYHEGQFDFVIMENVPDAADSVHVPAHWHAMQLSDWDCGGLTARKRMFWTYPFTIIPPQPRPKTATDKPEYSVMSSTYKRGRSTSQYCKDKGFLPGDLPVARYGELQGHQAIAEGLEKYGFSRRSIIQMLGNGVPYAMGRYVADQVAAWLEERQYEERARTA